MACVSLFNEGYIGEHKLLTHCAKRTSLGVGVSVLVLKLAMPTLSVHYGPLNSQTTLKIPVVCAWLSLELKHSLGEPVLYNSVMNFNEMAMTVKSDRLQLGSEGTAVCTLDL